MTTRSALFSGLRHLCSFVTAVFAAALSCACSSPQTQTQTQTQGQTQTQTQTPAAQGMAAPLSGKWEGTFASARGTPIKARVVIGDEGGSWQTLLGSGGNVNQCIGRTHSIEISERTTTTIAFTIAASKTLQGCTDGTVELTRQDDGSLKGTIADRANKTPLVLTR